MWRERLAHVPRYSTHDDQVIRVRGADLRDAAKNAARLRSTDSAGQQPILIEMHTLVDDDVSEALRRYSDADAAGHELLTRSIHYVGTPAGLAGLVEDLGSLDIADGVVLTPCSCVHSTPWLP